MFLKNSINFGLELDYSAHENNFWINYKLIRLALKDLVKACISLLTEVQNLQM